MRLLILTLLLCPLAAQAHPVDRDFSLPPYILEQVAPEDREAFETCHDDYWHERRELFTAMGGYSGVAGDINRLSSDLGIPNPVFFQELLNYPNVVPSHPVIDGQRVFREDGSYFYRLPTLNFCLQQLDAALFTANLAKAHLEAAELYRDFLLWVRR